VTTMWIGLAVGILGTVADYYYTLKGLEAGVAGEKNRFTKWVISKLGLRTGLVVKALVFDLSVLLLGVWFFGIYFGHPYAAGGFATGAGVMQAKAAYHWRHLLRK